MATELEITRLRADLDVTEAQLDDTAAEAIFTEAAESYTDAATTSAYARVIAIRRLLAAASKRSGYRKNQTTENLQEVVENLKGLLTLWQAEVDRLDKIATASSGGKARFGKTKRKPATVREYPGYV